MQDVFKALEEMLGEIIPEEIKYAFKEKIETDQTYEFILVIEEKDSEIFRSKKSENLIDSITNICNSEISNFSKKIVIDLEVLEIYA